MPLGSPTGTDRCIWFARRAIHGRVIAETGPGKRAIGPGFPGCGRPCMSPSHHNPPARARSGVAQNRSRGSRAGRPKLATASLVGPSFKARPPSLQDEGVDPLADLQATRERREMGVLQPSNSLASLKDSYATVKDDQAYKRKSLQARGPVFGCAWEITNLVACIWVLRVGGEVRSTCRPPRMAGGNPPRTSLLRFPPLASAATSGCCPAQAGQDAAPEARMQPRGHRGLVGESDRPHHHLGRGCSPWQVRHVCPGHITWVPHETP